MGTSFKFSPTPSFSFDLSIPTPTSTEPHLHEICAGAARMSQSQRLILHDLSWESRERLGSGCALSTTKGSDHSGPGGMWYPASLPTCRTGDSSKMIREVTMLWNQNSQHA